MNAEQLDPLDRDLVAFEEYLQAAWRSRWLIVACAALATFLAMAYSLSRPRMYRAETTLAVAQSKIGDDPGQLVTPATFRPLLESRSLVSDTIQEFKLDQAPHFLTVSTFLWEGLSIDEVRGTPLIRLSVTLLDPKLAAEVANRIAARGAEVSRGLSADEAIEARDQLQDQLAEARLRLDQAQEALRAHREKAQVELLKKDVEAMLEQRGRLLALNAQIAAERARLARARRELDSRSKVETLARTIDREQVLHDAARSRVENPADVLGLRLQSEELSGVFAELDTRAAISEMTLAALESERAELTGVGGISASRQSSLPELYSKESEQRRLQLELDLAEKVYQQVATGYESARLRVVSRSSQLQVLQPAMPPDLPQSRRVLANGAVAGGLVALLTLVSVLASHRRRRAHVPSQ